jgi:hypothetical protein
MNALRASIYSDLAIDAFKRQKNRIFKANLAIFL